ncbi:MAG: hypothetical protein KGI27_11140 [Thaumarchaeota archaeon]|nr:hypothetical protein [Nitrososphaerota archaeon]
MLFKNHDNKPQNSTLKLKDILSQKQINSVLYSDPFLKAGFISKLVSETKNDVLYVDLDLLYSGYIASGALTVQENLILYQPSGDDINDILTEILVKASMSQVLIIVDSINGLYNVLNYKKQAGKAVASIVMLLASTIRKTNSSIVIASMARYKREEGWVLSPTGKRFIETKNSKKILLEHGKEGIIVNLLGDSGKILLPAHSIPL